MLIGDDSGLLAAWERYSNYFEGSSQKGEFFPESKKYLIHDVAKAVEYLKSDQQGRYRRLVWMMRYRRVWTAANRKKLRKASILLLRLAIHVGVLASSIAPLFR